MRVRLPFAAVFLVLLLLAAYVGLTKLQLTLYVNDKVLHCFTFFLLTLVFYWIVDTNRRRSLNITLVVCTLVLGVGSEFVQSFLPNDRDFDIYDIVANIVGSLAAVGICSWYHQRMLERKRQRKTYNAVPGDDEEDLELGESSAEGAANRPGRSRTLEEEVDNWDENAIDQWDEDDGAEPVAAPSTSAPGKEPEAADLGDAKKRVD
ncbi:hypothetical protein S40293_02638 [Stachybotrys chartarum IBT 40293]|nr:hypothetical protein S40293_02638 [Stachybotrys chartarum IBT 40293]KFA72854.1 hypothetical protein S40288_02177 [Stachybotrys chartarum IBT 40288]